MASSLYGHLNGYQSTTVSFKSTKDGDILLDVAYPEVSIGASATVLIHYHGGFLVVGDRYAFFPYWLVNACAKRNWIFVTPDYRLIPESTAHSSVEDAVDAYNWVVSSLGAALNIKVESIVVAGSSAGGYLALTVGAMVQTRPKAVLMVYGMLDPAYERYTTPGSNIFGRPAVDTAPILARFPEPGKLHDLPQISAYALPTNIAEDGRFPLITALHLDALFPDYLTGEAGLSLSIAAQGTSAISPENQVLFPLTFASLEKFPPAILLHGRNDSAVPFELSRRAEEKLRAAGNQVHVEFPADAEHGFDARAGNVDIESSDGEQAAAFQSIRNVISHLDRLVSQQRRAGGL